MTITIGNTNVNRTVNKITECVSGVNKSMTNVKVGNSNVNRTVFSIVTTKGAYFDGAGDYLTVPDSDDWIINADFTIELKLNFAVANTTSMYYLCGHANDTSNYWFLRKSDSLPGQWRFQLVSGGSSRISMEIGDASTAPIVGAITNVALVRYGNVYTIYVNGTSVGSTTSSYAFPNLVNPFVLGIAPWNLTNAPFNGYMKGVRITRRARYTSNYTPPTEFSVDGTDVKLCMRFAEAVGATTFIDDTGKTVTTVGNVVMQ